MINKNREIKTLEKDISALRYKMKDDKDKNAKYRNKYKTELIKQQDKFSNVIANLKTRIQFLEEEVNQ